MPDRVNNYLKKWKEINNENWRKIKFNCDFIDGVTPENFNNIKIKPVKNLEHETLSATQYNTLDDTTNWELKQTRRTESVS